MYCAKCGTAVHDDEIYCKKCKRDMERGDSAHNYTPAAESMDSSAPGKTEPMPVYVPPVQPRADAQAPQPAAPQAPGKLSADAVLLNLSNQLPALKRGMITNFFICLGGLLISMLSFSAVSQGGGTYFVFWGAVAYGGWRFFRCLYYYTKIKGRIESLKRQQVNP